MPVNKAYNDGVVVVCREVRTASSFSARQGALTKDDLEPICKLDFFESSCRAQDNEYANQMGFRLDRKICCRKPGNIRITVKCAAVIGRKLYHVSDVDYSRTEVYLYLTEVRELEDEELEDDDA